MRIEGDMLFLMWGLHSETTGIDAISFKDKEAW